MLTPKTCCDTTPTAFFSADQMTTCSKKKDKKLNDAANTFMANLLQQGSKSKTTKNQMIAFTDKNTIKTLCTLAVCETCLFLFCESLFIYFLNFSPSLTVSSLTLASSTQQLSL
jgi:hypothetical protein